MRIIVLDIHWVGIREYIKYSDMEVTEDKLKGIEELFPEFSVHDYDRKEMKVIAENLFPERYKLWCREVVGGNVGVHKKNVSDGCEI